ncbi:MAG TPA: hypothetical protein VHA57_00730, partial [Actinomycetota bacterium]|nr:hypothetical protein [Actinomycetota bacterium]
VQPPPYPRQPTPPGQVAEKLSGLVLGEPEDPGGFGYVKGTVTATVQLFQVGPVMLADPST